ncbi:hypothetical protein [Fictibacillus sp. S7]|uniref:hypothetical protein n=1 Tax=Fictibacillus sp. S7 TaxID=2212476 RepID=UPI0010126D23|nr:hypothetical protein [Fictibacillus sp. S7]RXY98554.1 hypothetical protein DMO16_02100 [Fictibacillus sp. S7]
MKIIFEDGITKTVLTYQEYVHLKGNESQIKKFTVDGKLPTNQLRAITTRFLEEYTSVEPQGKGKQTVFILGEKRQVPVRLDKRQDNKGNEYQTPIAKPVENMIVRMLLENEKTYKGAMSNIMFHSGLAGHFISYSKSPSNAPTFMKILGEAKIIDKHPFFINHVFNREYATLENQIISAFNRMERSGIINWSKKKVGVIKTFKPKLGKLTNKPIVDGQKVQGSYQEIYKELNDIEEQELAKVERELQEKYNIEPTDIIYRKNSSYVKAYQSELKEKFQELGFDYYYTCYFLYLKASNQRVKKKYNFNDELLDDHYYKSAIGYSLKKADDYQNSKLETKEIGFGTFEPIGLTPVKSEIYNGTYLKSYTEVVHHTLPEDFRHLLPLEQKPRLPE